MDVWGRAHRLETGRAQVPGELRDCAGIVPGEYAAHMTGGMEAAESLGEESDEAKCQLRSSSV